MENSVLQLKMSHVAVSQATYMGKSFPLKLIEIKMSPDCSCRYTLNYMHSLIRQKKKKKKNDGRGIRTLTDAATSPSIAMYVALTYYTI